jgi:hypothetical protein
MLERLSTRSTTAEHIENEEDMIAVCDLADDLRDTIIEYQVSAEIEKRTPDSPLMQLVVFAAGGNLRAEL